MLVSSIVHFNAARNKSVSSQNLNKHTFSGDKNIEFNKRLNLDLTSNQLLQKITYMQEKFAYKGHKFNTFA